MNDQPLWDRVLQGFADRRAAMDGFRWEPDRLVLEGTGASHIDDAETLFAVSNGFLGIRGALEEDEPSHERATLLNGFHETWPIVYGEAAYGFAKTGQTIVPVPDPTTMKLYVDDEPFRMDRRPRSDVRERSLDWRAGIVRREVEWETPDGRSPSPADPALRLARAPPRGRARLRGRDARCAGHADHRLGAGHPAGAAPTTTANTTPGGPCPSTTCWSRWPTSATVTGRC